MTAVSPTARIRPPVRTAPAKPSSRTYMRYELLRTFRNKRFLIFSLVFPLTMFFLVAGTNKNERIAGISFPTYYMVGMLGWGSMAAVIAGGARIAAERSIGWHRQLRVTPLSIRTYFSAKVLSGYALACFSIVFLYAAGMSLGVRLSAVHWLELTGYVLVALLPFAVIGVIIGHLLTVDSMGPALGGITSLFAILGGSWGPIATSGWLRSLVELLPSYWLVQAANSAVGGGPWPAKAWIVIAVWTVVMVRVAMRVYQRDTDRV
jgi:ABC-2 type transport system permease protein